MALLTGASLPWPVEIGKAEQSIPVMMENGHAL